MRISDWSSDVCSSDLETEVARRVEDALSSVTGVKHLRTSITDGSVAISVEFLLEKNLSDALVETKDAIDGVRSDLPADLREPVVTAVDRKSTRLNSSH